MARTRNLGLRPQMTELARSLLRQGWPTTSVLASVASEFPSASTALIRDIVFREEIRQEAVNDIMTANRGQFANIAELAGCDNRGMGVRVRIVLHYTDAVSGIPQERAHTVYMRGSGRLGNILDTAISEVVEVIRGLGYEVPSITSGMKSGETNYEIAYADCIP